MVKNTIYLLPKTKNKKKIGMNIFKKSPIGCGMIFPYNKEEKERSFTLEKTPFDLLIIFLDSNNKIVKVEKAKKYQKKLVICKKPSCTIIEIPV